MRSLLHPVSWFALGVALGSPSALYSQSRPQVLSRALWETPAQDLWSIFAEPVRDGRATLLGASVLLGLVATDGWTTRQYQEHLAPLGEDLRSWLPIPSLVGEEALFAPVDGYAVGALAATYAAGALTDNVKLQEAGLLSLKAVLESYLISHLVLKTAFARNRPNDPLQGGELQPPFSRNPWDFFNWHRSYLGSNPAGTSFPSFHFTFYFAVARVMRLTLGNTWIPYTLAAFPLLYEADNHRHWVSDMTAGAAIGTLVGTVVVRNYETDRSQCDGPKSHGPARARGQGAGWLRRQLSRLNWSAVPHGRRTWEFRVKAAF